MSTASSTGALDKFYASETARIARGFELSGNGRLAVQQRTELAGNLVVKLWRTMFGEETRGFALAAIGGFGRGELFPHSDIDLLFLCAEAPTPEVKLNISTLCRELWDAGLRASPVMRTQGECDRLDPGNVEGALSLLDCRFLVGDAALFRQLHDDLLPRLVRREWQSLVQGVAQLARDRHGKFGNTIFHLEPNVKECPGGLRDQHTAYWLALIAALDKQRAWPDRASLVPSALQVQFGRACEFLADVRCFLHYRHGRDDNKLTWDAQEQAAASGIGLSNRAAVDAASWMRTYFQHARAIHRFMSQVLEDIPPARSSLFQQFQQWRSRVSNQDFSVVGGRVFLQQATAISDPDLLLRLFGFIARHGFKLSADTERRAEQVLPTIAERLPRGPALWSHLREILLAPHAAPTLRAMHSLGLLTQIIPEFKLVDSLVLRDFYHRYTVDEHTFLAIENLQRLNGSDDDRERRFAEMLSEVKESDLLYLAILLHDLGKGGPGDQHVQSSVAIAEGILERLGLNEHERETVIFLIANHLELSATLRRDIFDSETIRNLADKIGTPERLQMLCLLTWADIKSVNPAALTPWKAEMLWQLYIATVRRLNHSVDQERIHGDEAQVARVISTFPDRATEIREFLNGLPQRYLRTYAEQAAFHFQLVSQLRNGAIQLSLNLNRDLFELTVVTGDRPGLFATIAGFLFAWGMSIIKADAFSHNSGIILDTFHFSDRFGTLTMNPPERERFKRNLEEVLCGEANLEKLVLNRLRSERPGTPPVKIEPKVEFDGQCSSHSTVIEIIAQDRPGLLYDVASLLAAEQCNIEVALIDTQGHMAVDVFYLTSERRKLDAERQQRLAAQLIAELH
ncbi:MAG: [protein-PII] uridylyltransferase [Terriglobales bacterium]